MLQRRDLKEHFVGMEKKFKLRVFIFAILMRKIETCIFFYN